MGRTRAFSSPRRTRRGAEDHRGTPFLSSVSVELCVLRASVVIGLLFLCISAAPVAFAQKLVTVPSRAPLMELRLMVKAGSVHDPPGREGLAYLTARLVLDGSFGDPKHPVTKEKLAEITRPWGELATPQMMVDKETTTFSAAVPRDVYELYLREVWGPMFTRPLFAADELERLRKETSVFVSSELRHENAERLGLEVLDATVLGDRYAHPVQGTVSGLAKITRDDVLAFHRTLYVPGRAAAGVVTDSAAAGEQMRKAVAGIGQTSAAENRPEAGPRGEAEANAVRLQAPPAPPAVQGHKALIVIQPNAIASGIHAGFPYRLSRTHPDYWPLFVANVFFGTHRDSFGRLYQNIREDRGYNYGNYSYLEWAPGRYVSLFPSPNTPRSHQYFSVWIRPVAHQYTHFLMKALASEVENLIKNGLTPEQVRETKDKARILYLNLAETAGRLVGYRLDDWFYDMLDDGYMETYLKRIDAVTPEQVNGAIRKYLQVENLQYVVITDRATAEQLKADLPTGKNAQGKKPEEYQIEPPEKKQRILAVDKLWSEYSLKLEPGGIRVVPSGELFK